MASINPSDDVIMNTDDSSFSGVLSSVCGLLRRKQMVRRKVVIEAAGDNSLNELGDKTQIGNRSIGGDVGRVERWLLKPWSDYGYFLGRWKKTQIK